MAAARRPISRRQHGVVELAYIATLPATPRLAGFADAKTPARLTRLLSGASLLTSFFTRAEWGVVKALPYRAHLAVDVAAGLGALAAPWLLGFADNARARNTFLAVGALALTVASLSRPEEMPDAPRRAGR